MLRARLALPGEKRSNQPSTSRCCGGTLAFSPASSTRASRCSAAKGDGAIALQPADPPHHLFRELDEGLSSLGLRIEHDAGQAVAGRLCEPDIARNDGIEHLLAEVRLQLLADLLLQRNARVV